jgi:hypothetical protein
MVNQQQAPAPDKRSAEFLKKHPPAHICGPTGKTEKSKIEIGKVEINKLSAEILTG